MKKIITVMIVTMILIMSSMIIPVTDKTIPAHTMSAGYYNIPGNVTAYWVEGAGVNSWNTYRNYTAGVSGGPVPVPIIGAAYDPGYIYTVIWRTFLWFDVSSLPVGGKVSNVSLILSFHSGMDHMPITFISDIEQIHPSGEAPLPGDFNIKNYDLNYSIGGGLSHIFANGSGSLFYFNSTGRDRLSDTSNITNSSIHFGFAAVEWCDYTGIRPSGSSNPAIGSSHSTYLNVTYENGTNRIIPPPRYEDMMNEDILLSLLRGLLWFIGLGGMVIIPMLVYAKTRESGDMGERFNKGVMLVGMFIVCLALFFWAIS